MKMLYFIRVNNIKTLKKITIKNDPYHKLMFH